MCIRDSGVLRSDCEALIQELQLQEHFFLLGFRSDILTRANNNAQTYMQNFLSGLGFTEVIFTPDTPPAVAPYQQEIPKGYYLLPVSYTHLDVYKRQHLKYGHILVVHKLGYLATSAFDTWFLTTCDAGSRVCH